MWSCFCARCTLLISCLLPPHDNKSSFTRKIEGKAWYTYEFIFIQTCRHSFLMLYSKTEEYLKDFTQQEFFILVAYSNSTSLKSHYEDIFNWCHASINVSIGLLVFPDHSCKQAQSPLYYAQLRFYKQKYQHSPKNL